MAALEPFLAVHYLKQLGDDNIAEYLVTSKTILEDFYVVDFIVG